MHLAIRKVLAEMVRSKAIEQTYPFICFNGESSDFQDFLPALAREAGFPEDVSCVELLDNRIQLKIGVSAK